MDLKEVSIRLFQSFGGPNDVSMETTDEESDSASREESDSASRYEPWWGEYEQVLISKGRKPTRNRPGAYSTSVRGSIANLNVPNGYGKA